MKDQDAAALQTWVRRQLARIPPLPAEAVARLDARRATDAMPAQDDMETAP